jgi:hypothetical protein
MLPPNIPARFEIKVTPGSPALPRYFFKKNGQLGERDRRARASSRYGWSLMPRASCPRLPAKQTYRDMAKLTRPEATLTARSTTYCRQGGEVRVFLELRLPGMLAKLRWIDRHLRH